MASLSFFEITSKEKLFSARHGLPDLHEPFESCGKSGLLFGKVEPDQMVDILAEKTGAGNGADAGFFRQKFAEFKVAFESELRNVDKDVISALRRGMGKSRPVKSRQKEITQNSVLFFQLSVIVIAEIQRRPVTAQVGR